jgi:hypothetical protein
MPQNEFNENYGTKTDIIPLTDEDKIIIEHLFDRHRVSITSGDSIDLKLAQMIALNGIILSFILIKSPEIKNLIVFIFGIGILICAIIIGIIGYRSTEWCVGANEIFFKEWNTKFSSKEGVKKLVDMLSNDIHDNKKNLYRKAKIFDCMLYFNITGLILVVIGYYV